MGLDMNGLMGNVQNRVKLSSFQVFTYLVKLFSGFMLGLTFSLIAQEVFDFGTFSFVFIILIIMGAFLKVVKRWRLMSVLLFDAFCILVGFLLKMYILIAPGA